MRVYVHHVCMCAAVHLLRQVGAERLDVCVGVVFVGGREQEVAVREHVGQRVLNRPQVILVPLLAHAVRNK